MLCCPSACWESSQHTSVSVTWMLNIGSTSLIYRDIKITKCSQTDISSLEQAEWTKLHLKSSILALLQAGVNYYTRLQAAVIKLRNACLSMSKVIYDSTSNKEALSYEEMLEPVSSRVPRILWHHVAIIKHRIHMQARVRLSCREKPHLKQLCAARTRRVNALPQ